MDKLTKKIIIADDEPDFAIKPVLEKEGYKVSIVGSAKEFIDMLKNDKYDFGLIDFFMPEMSGRELVERIRKAKIMGPKFIFLNVAYFGAKGKEELRNLGISAYIHDVSKEDFRKFLKEIG